MRTTIFAVFILVFAPISGLVAADNESQQNLLEGEQNLILPTYSVAVQLAFERVSDLEHYSTEELDNTGEWLIVSANNIDDQLKMMPEVTSIQETSQLQGTFIWNFDSSEKKIEKFQKLTENGDIESFSPLIKKQQITRSIPNDEVFNLSLIHISEPTRPY